MVVLHYDVTPTVFICSVKKNQGLPWSGVEPPEDYLFQVTISNETSEMKPVSDAEDAGIPNLLVWLYNNVVHRVPGDDVIKNEELIYIVQKTVLEHEPTWCARVECFSILDQQQITVCFKIAGQA